MPPSIPNFRDGRLLRNLKNNSRTIIKSNPQYFRVYKRAGAHVGELGNRVGYDSDGKFFSNAVLVYSLFGRLARGKRGKRPIEEVGTDQSSITDIEWHFFFPPQYNIEHGHYLVDRIGNKYFVISVNPQDVNIYEGIAIVHQIL